MKKKRLSLWKVSLVIVALAVIAFLIRTGTDRFFAPFYDAAIPTDSKYSKMAKWIPASAEFEASADVKKIIQNPKFAEGLKKFLGDRGGVVGEFARALLAKQDTVGLITLVGAVGDKGAEPSVALIAQGGFDKESFIPTVRKILSSGHAGLVAEKAGDRTIYLESDVRDPFGFVVLDNNHIAVGNRETLVGFFGSDSKFGGHVPFQRYVPPEFPEFPFIFGKLVLNQRLTEALPKQIPPITSVEFESADGNKIVATIPCLTAGTAKALRMFLEGIKSLLTIQEAGNEALTRILKITSITEDQSDVRITLDLSSFF